MAGSGWSITGQVTDQVNITPAGQVIAGVNIYFQTGAGNAGVVFIANEHYGDKARVRAVIAQQAAHMDEIGALYDNPS